MILVGVTVLLNIVSNWDFNNYRSKSDYADGVSYINKRAIPATIIYGSPMENGAFIAHNLLGRLRRDFVLERHNVELNAEFFKPGQSRINLPAFFYHRDLENKEPLYYVKDFESIRNTYFIAPLEKNPVPKFRHIVADNGNVAAYQGATERNIYYLLPKLLEGSLNQSQLELRGSSLRAGSFYFLSNAVYDEGNNTINAMEMSFPINIFVPIPNSSSGKIELDFYLKRIGNGCYFKTAQVQYFYNNNFIKQREINLGQIQESLVLPKNLNNEVINVLSLTVSFDNLNQFSPSHMVPNLCQIAVSRYRYEAVPDFS